MRLEEHEVTTQSLSKIFKNILFKTSFDDDGDLIVYTDGPRVLVTLNSSQKLTKFMSLYGVKKSARLDIKHELINKLNDQYIFVRFAIPEKRPDVLMADYYLPFEEGVSSYQVAKAIRLFAQVVPNAIRASDTHDLVE